MSRAIAALLLIAATVLPWPLIVPQAEAHNRSQSFATWIVSDGSVDLLFTVKAREATRLPALEGNLLTLEALLAAHLRQTVRVKTATGAYCSFRDEPRAISASAGYLVARASYDCQADSPTTILLDSFFSVAPSHVNYARVLVDGQAPLEYLFTDSRREYAFAAAQGGLSGLYHGFLQYLVLGVEHILGGFDHLAFLAALLILVRGLRELVWIVTGFTVGHSITLSLAVLGQLSLQMPVIEALIGFTIALVAADNIGLATGRRALVGLVMTAALLVMGLASALWDVGLPLLTLAGLALFTVSYLGYPADSAQARGMRPALTLAFGMVHGFGFANVLGEMGLPDERLAVALAGFNIGVELGQLAIVAALWLLARCLARRRPYLRYQQWLDTVSAGLCGVGVFLLVSRSFVQL